MAVDGVNNNPYAFLNSNQASSANETAKQDTGTLAMEQFMSLMTTQLKNQDPLKPMENGDFLGQIASFAQVSGINELKDSFNSFTSSMKSDQALQGSSLVGRYVMVPSSIGMLSTEGMLGKINVDEPVSDLKVSIYSEAGELVRTINVGGASGETPLVWDGIDNNGDAMPTGVYQFKATGTVDGQNTVFNTSVVAGVQSVLVGANELTVNLAGIGSVPFSDVSEII